MNKESLRQRLKEAMKAKNPAVSTLRVIIGEIDLQEVKEGKPLDSERIYKIITKIKDGCEETLKHRESVQLIGEIRYLDSLLPQKLTKIETMQVLSTSSVFADIKEAKSDGQAIGAAMKYCKGKWVVDSSTVGEVVKEIRCTQ